MPWDEVGADAHPAEAETDYYGSNVDPGDHTDIQRELALSAYLMDEAYRKIARGLRRVPLLRQDVRLQYAATLEQRVATHGAYNVAKALAESDCRAVLCRLEQAEAELEDGKQQLRQLEGRLSSAQTRARMWMRIWDTEHRGHGA